MNYINAEDILPEELLNKIQDYTEGRYLYIPKRNEKRMKWGEGTNYKREMELRNLHIYDKYLEGVDIAKIARVYHLSTQSIRRIILQEKREKESIKIMMEDIVNEWNIKCIPKPIYHSAWDIDNRYVLKAYNDLTALERNIVMMKTLYEAGIPVPKIIALPSGSDYYKKDNRYYIMITKLRGSNIIDLNNCKIEWFYRFGEILAQLHLAFQKCEIMISHWNNSILGEMKGWVSSNINKLHPDWLILEDVRQTLEELEDLYEDLPNQLIHRDVHLGNFLFDGEKFSGYIDFDLSQRNIRIFDLCYFLLGILLEEDNNRVEEMKWLSVVSQVVKGYNSKISLSDAEKMAFSCVMKNIELLFVGYFLGEGDEKLAKDSADLFYFIKNNESKIQDAIKTC